MSEKLPEPVNPKSEKEKCASKSTVSRQVVWAKKKRAWLMGVLGGRCQYCGLTTNLTFDCIRPTGGVHHRLSSVLRMTFYVAQFRQGNLQILCHACNSAKGAKPQPRYLRPLLNSPITDAASDSNRNTVDPHSQGSAGGLS